MPNICGDFKGCFVDMCQQHMLSVAEMHFCQSAFLGQDCFSIINKHQEMLVFMREIKYCNDKVVIPQV